MYIYEMARKLVSLCPTAFKGYVGIVFTHGIRMGRAVGKSLSGLYLRNHNMQDIEIL